MISTMRTGRMKTHKSDEKRKKLFSELGHKSLKKYDHESLETDMPIHETEADRDSTKRKAKNSKVTAEESEGKMTSKTKNGPYPKGHEAKMKKAMNHPDKLGAGAAKRKELHGKDKIAVNMREMKRGTLRSGSGAKVTNPKQALAISFSEMGEGKHKPKKHKK